MELVVAEVQGGVDRLKRLKVDIDFLLLAFLCHNGATVHNQTIGWHWQEREKVRGHLIQQVFVQIHKQNSVSVGEASIIQLSQIHRCIYALIGSEQQQQSVTTYKMSCLLSLSNMVYDTLYAVTL